MDKEDLKAVGIPNGQLLLKFQRVCNSILKQGRISKAELLGELEKMVVAMACRSVGSWLQISIPLFLMPWGWTLPAACA